MTLEWTRERTVALIQEYRKRRGLWDMTHEDYRKKDVKNKLLVEVGDSLGGNIPIMELEKKFHTLRTQYHREINRMKRKEPYNSKWFGFKYLQFLSSPKACRTNKGGRIKAEITEEGTVTTKYIIREAHDTSGEAASGNENEEFLTVQRKPNNLNYEQSTPSTRSQELEKLIEETTKDVEDIEDSKPKMTIKEIIPMNHHHDGGGYGGGELHITNVDTEDIQPKRYVEQHHQHHMAQDDDENMESVNIQSDEDLTTYNGDNAQYSATSAGGASTNMQSATTTVHTIPARIIPVRIQRRETHHETEQYHDNYHGGGQQQHIQASPAGNNSTTTTTTKRIYYDASGHHTTILTATPTATASQTVGSNVAILNSPSDTKFNLRNTLQQPTTPNGPPPLTAATTGSHSPTAALSLRDEFSTYGEYVANEMRGIKGREILIALKHKINTALFEASMQELHK